MDRIQRYLVKEGREDLAQYYYEKYAELKREGLFYGNINDVDLAIAAFKKDNIRVEKKGNNHIFIPGTHTKRLDKAVDLKNTFRKIDPTVSAKGDIAWQSIIGDKERIYKTVKKILGSTIKNERDMSTDKLAIFYYDFNGTVKDIVRFMDAAILKTPVHMPSKGNAMFGINNIILQFNVDYAETMNTRVLEMA